MVFDYSCQQTINLKNKNKAVSVFFFLINRECVSSSLICDLWLQYSLKAGVVGAGVGACVVVVVVVVCEGASGAPAGS